MLLKNIQSMVSMRYLYQTAEISKADIISHLNDGYGHIMERRQDDGSFQYKGHSKYLSIWLTAYIVKSLGQVRQTDAIQVDDEIVVKALTFLKNQQSTSGEFTELGADRVDPKIINFSLTAHVVISFLENPSQAKDFQSVIDKALNFLDMHLTSISERFDMAIVAYALSLAKHASAKDVLKALTDTARQTSNKIHWGASLEDNGVKSFYSLSDKIEIASYALLAFLQMDKIEYQLDIRQIMLWIVSQVEADGAFSKKDSFITAQALAEVSKIYFNKQLDLLIDIDLGNDQELEVNFTKSNPKTTQDFVFPGSTRYVGIYANGEGLALLKISYSYDTEVDELTNPFFLSVAVEPTSTEDYLLLTVCTNIRPPLESDTDSGEVIMEVKLPDGYVGELMQFCLFDYFNFADLHSTRFYTIYNQS